MSEKILILCAGYNYNNDKLNEYAKKCDYIICADGGYDYALSLNVKPDVVIGDFDSIKNICESENKITLPVEKDETDTLSALNYAIEKNPSEIIIYAGVGSRFDHSYANVCLLKKCLDRKIRAVVTDGFNKVYLIDKKMQFLSKKGTTVSVYSFSDWCENVTLKGFYYPLCNYNLDKYDILGTSNVITEDSAEITLDYGNLLVICNENKNI